MEKSRQEQIVAWGLNQGVNSEDGKSWSDTESSLIVEPRVSC